MSQRSITFPSVRLAYVPALIAAVGANLWIALYDMRSLWALLLLSVTLVAPAAAMMLRKRQLVVVVAGILFQFGFVVLAGFTIGSAYLPSAVLLLAGGIVESIVAAQRITS